MKIIKAKIEVTHNDGGTQYVGYPKVWLDNKEKIEAILYPSDRTDEVAENGKTYQIVYPIIPDDLYDELILLDEFEEPVKATLEAYADKHQPQRNIVDQERVIEILANVALGKTLTQKEKNAINVDHEERGINKGRKWIDYLQQFDVTNAKT